MEEAGGTSYTGGIWLKKACYIDGFAEGTATTATTSGTFDAAHKITATTDAAYATVTNGEYFFLPAAGHYNSGSLSSAGTSGFYWSSTPYSSTTIAWRLDFGSSNASVNNDSRSSGSVCGRCSSSSRIKRSAFDLLNFIRCFSRLAEQIYLLCSR
jgi:hypothetical protein